MALAVVLSMWLGLQNTEHTSVVECDARLAALFSARSVKMSSLSERLNDHLQPVEPLTVRYTVT